MRGSSRLIIIIVIVFLALIGMLGYIFFANPHNNNQLAASNNSPAPTLNIPVKDFAPNLPMSQKTTITIQTSDSSDIKYIVPTTQVDTYVRQLPPGYHVVSKTP